tara:strand:- start:127 stop:702 length:576 start_codon:yes stop_codon:yes gene_type:complete
MDELYKLLDRKYDTIVDNINRYFAEKYQLKRFKSESISDVMSLEEFKKFLKDNWSKLEIGGHFGIADQMSHAIGSLMGSKIADYYITEPTKYTRGHVSKSIGSIISRLYRNDIFGVLSPFFDGLDQKGYFPAFSTRSSYKPDTLGPIALSLFESLKELEGFGIAWEDLHIGNLMLGSDDKVKLMDVGNFQI